ncbi:MAG: PAS domain S-box protein [Ignavibacteriales bacterium]|nr:PAS domain S-box protein [Ignavibacteriales bacterium]
MMSNERLTYEELEQRLTEAEQIIAALQGGEVDAIISGRDVPLLRLKNLENALRRSEENFRNSMETSPLGIRIVTAEGEMLYGNQAMLDIYGYSSFEELRAAPAKQRYCPESYAEHEKRKEKRMRGEHVPSNYEIGVVRKDGEIRHLEVFRTEVLWNGKTEYQMLYRDITERKRMEERLRASEAYYRTLTEATPDALAILDMNGALAFASPKAIDMFGIPPEQEIIGTTILNWVLPDDRGLVKSRIQEILSGRSEPEPREFRLVKNDRTPFWGEINSSPIVDDSGNVVGLLIVCRDITERKQAEEELRQSEARYRAVLQSANDAIVTADSNGNISGWNKGAERIFGYSYVEAVGQSLICLMPESFRAGHANGLKRLQAGGGPRIAGQTVEMKGLRKDGTDFSMELSLATWEVSEGQFYTAIIRDITERKQREEERAYETRLHKFRSKMAYSINRQRSLGEVLQQSAEVIMRNLDVACAHIWIMNPETHSLELQAHAELSTLRAKSDECIHTANLLAGKVVAERQVIASNSILDGPLLMDASWARQHNIIAYAGFPVTVENQIVGVLTVFAGILLLEPTLSPLAGTAVTLAQGIVRKRAEEAIRESEERYRSLVDVAPDVIYTISGEDGSLTSLNPAFETLTGWSRAEWIGKSFASLIHPDDLPLAEETLRRALRGETQAAYELRVVSKSGKYRVGEFTSTPHVKDGKVVGELGVARDITERKQAEQRFEDERNLLSTLINAIPDEIAVKDLERRFVLANPSCVRALGKESADDVLGKKDEDLMPKEHAEDGRLQEEKVFSTGRPFVNIEEKIRRDPITGEVQRAILISKSPLRDNRGIVSGLVVVNRDITDLKRAEAALRVTEERFRSEFRGNPIPAYIWQKAGDDFVLVDFNTAAEARMHCNADVLRGTKASVFYSDRPDIVMNLARCYTERSVISREILYTYQSTRETRFLFVTFVPLPSNELVVYEDDVTDRKLAEQQLKTSQDQLRALAAYLQNVREDERTVVAREIHDELGQVLTALKVNLSLLEKEVVQEGIESQFVTISGEIKEMSGLVGSAIRTVQRLVTELRPEMLEILGLVDALRSQAEQFQRRTRTNCELSLPQEKITLDPDRSIALFRIFQEALTNVARHSNATMVLAKLVIEPEALVLEIKDNGQGISEAAITGARSFGIMGMRERAIGFGGNVEVRGIPGKGTVVTARISLG